MAQVVNLGDAAEEHYLNGRIWLQDAFEIFKSDLFMSSLTESSAYTACERAKLM